MKTLKTILIVFLLLRAVVSFGQTKEETIEWLNNNGSTLLNTGIFKQNDNGINAFLQRFEKIKNDTMLYYQSFDCQSCGDKTLDITIDNIPVSSILYQDVNTLVKMKSERNQNIGYFVVRLIPNTNVPTYVSISSYRKEYYRNDQKDKIEFYYQLNNEENAKRVLKAIMHLAKLSGAKENKQTF